MLDLVDVERVIVVTAHPDDLDFGSAGTIASFVEQGIDVSYCICTDGDAGGFDPAVPRDQIGGIRRREQTAAAQALGVPADNLHWLGFKDGQLTPSLELRHDITRVVRKVRPQLMLTQSPVRNFERIFASHPDHLAAGEAAMCVAYPDAQNPFTHTDLLEHEGLAEWNVLEVWMMGVTAPNHFVDTTKYLDRKIAALLAHESQTEHLGEAGLRERITGWNGELARQGGLPEGSMAEAFQKVDVSGV